MIQRNIYFVGDIAICMICFQLCKCLQFWEFYFTWHHQSLNKYWSNRHITVKMTKWFLKFSILRGKNLDVSKILRIWCMNPAISKEKKLVKFQVSFILNIIFLGFSASISRGGRETSCLQSTFSNTQEN